MRPFVTRLAPSPTGDLHLGNARTFLVTWLLARQAGGRIVLRVEDLDARRVKPGAIAAQIEQLRWLGLDWDDGPVLQSQRIERYATALDRLTRDGRVYPCVCSRKDVLAAASAPHDSDDGPRYPGICRGKFATIDDARAAKGGEPAIRFRVPEGAIAFDDGFRGATELDPSVRGGDFVVRSPDGQFSYQLAVTVDDAEMGVTEVIRGDDLLMSTPRQILVHCALGFEPPRFTHLPLVLAESGNKLSKRRRDLDLAVLRDRGMPAERIVAWIAGTVGIEGVAGTSRASELVDRFEFARMSREAVRIAECPV